jgi:dipeptidyl aminopeptidase/acylaminoacyl peptidase
VDHKSALVALPVDNQGRGTGKAQIVAPQVGRHPSTYWGAFSVALNGTVILHQGTGASLSQLAWYDRTGKELGKLGEPGLLANPMLSPDGQRVSFDVADAKGKNIDVYLYDLHGGTSTRFTFDPQEETTAVWSRDGKTIAFRSAAGPQNLRFKNSNGFESDHGVSTGVEGLADIMPNSFDPSDKQLLASGLLNKGGSRLYLLTVPDGKAQPFLEGRGNQLTAQISPDGKWVAYQSDESGEWEVYISPFPNGGGKLQVSQGGGTQPRWRGDGKEIFYIDFQGNVVAVPVNSEGSLSTGTPKRLFQSHARSAVSSSDLFSYDVTPDGQRFLIDRYMKPATTPPLSIILNSTSANQ